PKSKVHGVERSPAHEHEHAHGDTSDVSRPPAPYRQNTGHDRRCDAGQPEDLHPSVFLHATLLARSTTSRIVRSRWQGLEPKVPSSTREGPLVASPSHKPATSGAAVARGG